MRPWAALVVAISVVGSLGSIGYAQNKPIESQKVSLTGPPEETILDPTCKGFGSLSTQMLTIADDGSVFTWSGVPSQRYTTVSKNCQGKTWKYDLSVRAGRVEPGAIAAVTGRGGALYYTANGFSFDAQTGDRPRAVVGKLSASGSGAWETDIDPRWRVRGNTIIAVRPDGKVIYASAVSEGQLPRHPLEARGSRFVVAYDQKGQLVWFKQSKDFGRSDARLAVDRANNIYLFANPTLVKLNPKGDTQWRVALGNGHYALQNATLAVAPDGQSVYVVSGGPTMKNLLVAKVGASGKPAWSRLVKLDSTATIDPVEGTQWYGNSNLYQFIGAALSGGVLYVATSYSNSYALGFDPKPTHTDVLLTAVNYQDGSIIGAQQYRPSEHFSPSYFRALPGGSLVVVGKTSGDAADTLVLAIPPWAKGKASSQPAK